MEIQSAVSGKNGQLLPVFYRDLDNEAGIDGIKINSVRAYCFYKGKLVVVHEREGHCGLPGGSVEEGESARAATQREVKEETNMRIRKKRFVSVQRVIYPEGPAYHVVRMACLVEPISGFEIDPAGEVTEIKLIEPPEIISIADSHWGSMADRMLERALEANKQMESEIDFTR